MLETSPPYILQIIDKLLTIPLSVALTLLTGNFTALAGAAIECNILNGPTALEEAKDITSKSPGERNAASIPESLP